jgi:hypothetical protein
MPIDDINRSQARNEIPGDVLLPDEDFCSVVLDGATTRTARRLDAEGLPYVKVRGRKYRPLREGQAWLGPASTHQSALPVRLMAFTSLALCGSGRTK